jgi:D-alanine-D-alanine ligase
MPDGVAHIATAKVKWDHDYQARHGITTRAAKELPEGLDEHLSRLCKRIYRLLSLSGYARLDFRMNGDGKVYLLEANPNPNLAYGEDFAESANQAGVRFEDLLHRIVNLGFRYRAGWKEPY